jgi:hypothetical protein
LALINRKLIGNTEALDTLQRVVLAKTAPRGKMQLPVPKNGGSIWTFALY